MRDIVRLLAWQFSKPVIRANLVAWPIARWVMRDWLNGFDAACGVAQDGPAAGATPSPSPLPQGEGIGLTLTDRVRP